MSVNVPAHYVRAIDAAAMAGVVPSTITFAVQRGTLLAIRDGYSVWLDPDHVRRWIAARELLARGVR